MVQGKGHSLPVVSRRIPARPYPLNPPQPANPRSIPPRSRLLVALASLATSGLQAQTAPAQPPANSEPVSLSVFEVSTSRDIGYLSSHAAEATRMNTPIENIPMNVSIFNQQFIEDLL
ncbi:MAG TPA: hypothetical protein VGE76_22730, partial [Opitutaceae bacterium]